MDKFVIRGGEPLLGTIHISGAKNAALPCMAAALLTDQPVILENVPQVRDIQTTRNLLAAMGAAPLLASAQSAPLTREQVRAELFQAIRSGDMMGSGESSKTLRQINPRAYPAQAATGAKKTREQVQQELGQAIKSGEMMAAGESGAKLNEIAPGRYPSQAVAAVSPFWHRRRRTR